MTTATHRDPNTDLVDTFHVYGHGTTHAVAGTQVAPGLAITQHLADGAVTPGRYTLTHIQSGRSIVDNRCPTHIHVAADLAKNAGVDWARDLDTIRGDSAAGRAYINLQDEVPRCDTGRCGGDVNLAAWCAEQAANFRTFENREMAMWWDDAARDTGLVEWVIRVLARPENEGTAQVLEVIDRKRAGGAA